MADIRQGHVLDRLREMPGESVHCVVTSPPYWGLRDYGSPPQIWGGDPGCDHDWGAEGESSCRDCGAWRGALGLEPDWRLYLDHLVMVFREVRRVLRRDGTLWLNLGDSYATGAGKAIAAGGGAQGDAWDGKGPAGYRGGHGPQPKHPNGEYAGFQPNRMPQPGLKPKDLCGIPWAAAFALRDDGWWLRRDVIWAKQNPMPESTQDRCTTAHEYVFHLAKSETYFYDAEAVKETSVDEIGISRGGSLSRFGREEALISANAHRGSEEYRSSGQRSKRSVWWIATEPFPEAHFATFPAKLVEPCILAGTSARGVCPVCGAPWVRAVERDHFTDRPNSDGVRRVAAPGQSAQRGNRYAETQTLGWRASCPCGQRRAPVPAIVLDPFLGSGTTAMVAERLGRRAVGIELNPSYITMAERRAAQPGLMLA